MRISFFSPILLLLIGTLIVKIYTVFDKIETGADVLDKVSGSSVLIETAYASDNKQLQDKEVSPAVSAKSEDNQVEAPVAGNVAAEKPHATPIVKPSLPSSIQQPEPMTGAELKLLQELSHRRTELDNNQGELKVREQVLKATETKIEQKMEELKQLQAKVEDVMKQYDQKELGKIHSLVKIYENMKPKDAAKIFDELEMPILLRVVSLMKEVKAAPIMANMNSTKARDLSMQLAEQKSIVGHQ